MTLKPLLSFSTGELDPKLFDNITLEKFKKGLATARNAMISKTGSIISRFSTAHVTKSKNDGEKIKLLSLPNSVTGNVKLMEWGPLYVRVHSVTLDFYRVISTVDATVVHTFVEDDLENMHFATVGDYVYVFVSGKVAAKYDYVNNAFETNFFDLETTAAHIGSVPTITPVGTPAGYGVDYAIGVVVDGEELIHYDLTSLGPTNVPIAAGQSVVLTITLVGAAADIDTYNEIKVYRRPNAGGSFGYLGSVNDFTVSALNLTCNFVDLGGNADFTNGPINLVTKSGLGGTLPKTLTYKTGTEYQGRLITAPDLYKQVLLASRPGLTDNFYRDFPYDSDSALSLKAGSEGNANILRMIDNDGLVVFTSKGIYISLGVLSVNNLGLVNKGGWVIDDKVKPLSVPGGVFFIDKKTNTVTQFIFNDSIGTYQGLEHSIFSNHLFQNKRVVSWDFQSGVNPIMIATFSDGTFATFTYSLEHQMRAWTRHDSEYDIEQVAGTNLSDLSFFVVNKGGNRYITASLPRQVIFDTAYYPNYVSESDKIAPNFFIDACESTRNIMNDLLGALDEFVLVPVVAGDWSGNLTLTSGAAALFTVGGRGVAGTIMQHFDTSDKTFVTLTVVSRTSDTEVIVKPSSTFPSNQDSGFNLYDTQVVVTGLDHLEGESVAVVVDGAVVASPNNDEENFDTYTVASGQITLAEKHRGSIIIVGRPITGDIKTLNITTAEQKPTMIESLTCNKVYIRVHETRGLYISGKFPEETDGEKDGSSVAGMEDLDLYYVPDGYDILVNKYKAPVSKRIEKTLPGNWDSNGQVSIRQVDPLHFEILSIIPDIEVLWRSDKS